MSTSSREKLVDIAGQILHETEKAWLVDTGDAKVWFPKSLVEDNDDGTFTIPEWLAKDKGLI